MSWRNPPNRSEEYRNRAEECRAQAGKTTDSKIRKTLLHTADTWDRMAKYEVQHNPPRPVPAQDTPGP